MASEKLQKIQELILQLAEGNYEARGPVSNDLDEYDAILNSLNMLGEELFNLSKKNQQLDAFFYKVAHDMKGYLNNINSLLTMGNKDLKISGRNERSREYYELANKSVQQLHHLLKGMMDLVKSGNPDLLMTEIDFEALLHPIISGIKDTQKDVAYDVRIVNNLDKMFYSSPAALHSIFQNIIENSLKYRRTLVLPKLKITISDLGDGISIVCKDNGMGIPLQILPKVFENFQRGVTEIPGNGLGLYIVKNTVEKALKGKVDIASKVNSGTTITLFLPYLQPARGYVAASLVNT